MISNKIKKKLIRRTETQNRENRNLTELCAKT